MNRNTFSLIPHVCYVSYHPRISASEDQSLTTLFSTKVSMRDTFTLTEGFVLSSYRCSKQSSSPLITVNRIEQFIWWGCFQICSGNNNTVKQNNTIK